MEIQGSLGQLDPLAIGGTSMGIAVAAARSRDETNLGIMNNFKISNRDPPPSVESTLPVHHDAALSTQSSIPTLSVNVPFIGVPSTTVPPVAVPPSITVPSRLGSALVRGLLSLNQNALRDLITELKIFMNNPQKMICPPCWTHRRTYSHGIDNCTDIAIGYTAPRSKYRSWKSKFDMPAGHCFNCALPQVSVPVKISSVCAF